jgi:outer membrane protein
LEPAIGVGLRVRQQAYVGIDRNVRAIPLLTYENSWLRLSGLQADLKLPRHQLSAGHSLTGGLRVRYEDEGYEPGDSLGLVGMAERKGSMWAGVAATWHNPWADLSVEWLADASRHSEGNKAQVQLSRRFTWNGFALRPRIQVDWLSSDYVDYYFGVRASEATLERPSYAGRSAVTQTLGLRTDYSLTRQHHVFLDLSVTRLPSEIEDSPVVDRRGTPRAFMGYLYRF